MVEGVNGGGGQGGGRRQWHLDEALAAYAIRLGHRPQVLRDRVLRARQAVAGVVGAYQWVV